MMIGRTLAHFRILETLGSGGMGDVYLAEDTQLGRRVAVKVLPSGFESDPERIRRFVREAQAASALNHPKWRRSMRSVKRTGFIASPWIRERPDARGEDWRGSAACG